MKKFIIALTIIILSLAIPYGIMSFNGTFTLKGYGNILSYVGAGQVLLAFFIWPSGITVGDRTMKGQIYTTNLYNDLADPNAYVQNKVGSILGSILLVLIGLGTIYFGYVLIQQ